MTYTLYETGPDNRSTYAECWGRERTSPGRVLARGDSVADLLGAVDRLEHDSWWVADAAGKYVAGSRAEYYALPAIAWLRWRCGHA